jgi:hypothetical protein
MFMPFEARLKLGVDSWYSVRLPIGLVFPGLSDPGSTLDGVSPTPSLKGSMPASKALRILLVCAYSAKSALSNDVNNDFVRDKAEKKSACRSSGGSEKKGKIAGNVSGLDLRLLLSFLCKHSAVYRMVVAITDHWSAKVVAAGRQTHFVFAETFDFSCTYCMTQLLGI